MRFRVQNNWLNYKHLKGPHELADVLEVSGAAADIMERALSRGKLCCCCSFSERNLASSSSCSFLFFSPFLISFNSFSISLCCSKSVLLNSLFAYKIKLSSIERLHDVRSKNKKVPCEDLKFPPVTRARSSLHYPCSNITKNVLKYQRTHTARHGQL